MCTHSFSGAEVADRCRFRHVAGEPIAVLPSWHVANLPVAATAADVTASFRAAMPMTAVELDSTGAAGREPAPARDYETVLHARGGNAERPYAHVTAMRTSLEQDADILAHGIPVCGALCTVKQRRISKVSRRIRTYREIGRGRARQRERGTGRERERQ